MLADALVQYLVLKRWRNVLLVPGPTDADKAYAAAVERAIKKFGARLVESKPWTFEPGARRTDTGHFQIASQVASFTQGLSYDVLVVADEEDNFGIRHALSARPIRDRSLELRDWYRSHGHGPSSNGARRSCRTASAAAQRWMTERDYAAWMAVRAVGEAATRARVGGHDQMRSSFTATSSRSRRSRAWKLSFRHGTGSCANRSCLPTRTPSSRSRRSRGSCINSPSSTRSEWIAGEPMRAREMSTARR